MTHTPISPAPRPASDRMIGRVLGDRYRVLSRLGEGGMGTVYLCEHTVLGRRYAVKVLRPGLENDPDLAERFRNEAIAASRIGGDHVVDVLDFGAEEDGALYYVMEALEGRSLGAIVAKEGPLEVDRVLGLLEQVCHALGVAHARGVIHRDVKPDNIFVVRLADGTEQAKVIDFGISRVSLAGARERLTRAGEIIGTPEYMAPEQAAGDHVDHRADVYALGVLAYELLTGTLPIVALTPVATLVAHQTRAIDPPSRRRASVPHEVDVLVLRALEKRPEDRPQTMDALLGEIARIRLRSPGAPEAQVRTLVRPRDTVALPEASLLRRHRSGRLRAIFAATLVALGGGVGWWASARRSPAAPRAPAAGIPAASPSASAAPLEQPREVEARPASAPAGAAAPSAAAPSSVPARPKAPTRTSRSQRRTDAHLEDPYATGALKADPFP